MLARRSGALILRAAGATSVVLCLAAAWWQARSSRELVSVARETSQFEGSLHTARSNGAVPAALGEADFALRLPASASADAAVRDLQRASAAASVAFVSFAATERPPTVQTLGRLELRAALRGPYAGAKSVFGEVMARQPGGVVQRVSMRQGANPSDLDTQIDLLLLTRPLSGPATSGGN